MTDDTPKTQAEWEALAASGHMQVAYEYPYFDDMVMPGGVLPVDHAAHACMYYCLLATKAAEKIGHSIDDQIILEGNPWLDRDFENLAWGVAKLYRLSDPGAFLKFLSYVESQFSMMGFEPIAADIRDPKKGVKH